MDLDQLADVTKRVVWLRDDGGVSITAPFDPTATWKQVISGALPAGTKFKIVEASEIPSDRSERSLWTWDEVNLTDGVA